MSDARDLGTILDRCLDDLAAGRATVEACLDRYPEQRAALEPLLAAAVAVRRPQPAERTPDPARRAAFMAEIRRTPQQSRPRFWASLARFMDLGGAFPRLVVGAAPVAAAVVIALVLITTQRATPAAASTLTLFSGTVERQRDEGWQPIVDGARVPEGARVRTSADGKALLTFPDGSTVSLDADTDIAVERIDVSPRVVMLRQYSGRLWNDVATDLTPGAAFEVHTADAVVQVHGTVFETAITDGQTAVSTAEGLVDVVIGGQRVSVPRGEFVRAEHQRVAERSAARPTPTLTVDGPFAAALIAPGGEATGAKTNGTLFRQIRGVTTSNPGDGPQRFDFQGVEPGDYTLNVQRFGAGAGTIALVGPDGQERRLTLDAGSGAANVRVRVGQQNGATTVALLDSVAPATPAPAPVRVVETPRTQKPEDLAAQRAKVESAGATARPALTSPATDEFTRNLRVALNGDNVAALRTQLQAVLEGSDAVKLQRLQVLAGLAGDGGNAARITRALAGDEQAALRNQLLQAGEAALAPEAQARFRRALLGEPTRVPDRAQTPPASPTASATATPRPPLPERTPTPTDTRTQRLREALGRSDLAAIRVWLADLVAPENADGTEAGLRTLAALTVSDENANKVTRALAGESNQSLRVRVLALIDTSAAADVRSRLLRTVLGQPSRVAPQPGAGTTPAASPTRPPAPAGGDRR